MAVMTVTQPASLKASEEAAPSADALARLRAGDPSATDAMIRRYAPVMRRVVAQLSGWSSETDDLVQDAFASALMAMPKFRGDADLETWLTRIAIHRVRRWQRRQVLRRLWQKTAASQLDAANIDDEPRGDVEETQQLVRDAIATLPPKYREVIALRYLEERTTADTASLLGLRANTVDVRAHRGRQLLAERLKEHDAFASMRTT